MKAGKIAVTRLIKSGLAGFVFTAFISFLLAGCQNSSTKYVLVGRVISKDPVTQQLVIDNNDIPGFMPAMTMPYAVKDPDGFARVQLADIIQADVVVGPAGKFWLDHLVVTGKGAAKSSAQGATPHVLMIGDMAPDVPMTNQDGKKIHFGQFKGKTILLTFIYTRCPFPDYCPLLSSRFAEIQKELAKNPGDYNGTHLISISLDPDFDKPAVLRKYGLSYLQNDPRGFEHWDFVSTTPADLQTLVSSFGLSYSDQNSQISHSMNTILLAADGTVANMWPGNGWQTSEVIDVMRHAAISAKSSPS
jgi:protein SCO1